jgi:hypothetical protein
VVGGGEVPGGMDYGSVAQFYGLYRKSGAVWCSQG